jgi:hypothetical protein
VNLGGESVEKHAVLYASALINDARVKRKENRTLRLLDQMYYSMMTILSESLFRFDFVF